MNDEQKVIDDYLEYVKTLNLSAITSKRRHFTIFKLLDFMKEKEIMTLSELKPSDIALFVEYLKKNVGKTMICVYEAGINAFFDYLVVNDYLPFNLLDQYKKPFTKNDCYSVELKKYYEDYLSSLDDYNKICGSLKARIRKFIYYLSTRKIYKLDEITTGVLDDFIDHLKEQQKKEGLKKNYVVMTKYCIKQWFLWMRSENIKLSVNSSIFSPRYRIPSTVEKEYLAFLKSKGYTHSLETIRAGLNHAFSFAQEIGLNDILEIDTCHIKDFKAYLMRKKFCRDVYNYRISILKLFFTYCCMNDILSKNPFSSEKKIKTKPVKPCKIVFRIWDRIPEEHRELFKGYLSYLKGRGHRERAIIGLKIRASVIFEYMKEKGFIDFYQIKIKEAQDYQGFIRKRGVRCKKYSNRTIKSYVCAATSFYKYLKNKKLVYNNPFIDIHRLRGEFTLPKTILKEKEMGRLLDELCCFNIPKNLSDKKMCYRLHVISELMYSTGLRIDEVSLLKVADIDLGRGLVRVNEGKGGHTRTAILNEYVKQILDIYIRETRELVFTQRNKKKLSYLFGSGYGSLGKILNKRLKKAGETLKLPYFRSHGFRHSLGTHLLRAGCDIRYVQAILGHKSLRNTEIYTRVEKDDLKEVLDRYHPRQFNKSTEPGVSNEQTIF